MRIVTLFMTWVLVAVPLPGRSQPAFSGEMSKIRDFFPKPPAGFFNKDNTSRQHLLPPMKTGLPANLPAHRERVQSLTNAARIFLSQQWTDTVWTNIGRDSADYDADGNETAHLHQVWNDSGSVWVNDQRTSTVWVNGLPVSYVLQTWSGSAWINSSDILYTYDLQGHRTGYSTQNWGDSVWVNVDQELFTFDVNGHQTSHTYQHWSDSAWANLSLLLFTYDANGNQLTATGQTWNGSAWVNIVLFSSTYDPNGHVTNNLTQSWNGTAWVNQFQEFISYGANGLPVDDSSQTWNGTGWVGEDHLIFTYDLSGHMITRVIQVFFFNKWTNDSKDSVTYDGSGHEINVLSQVWSIDSIWENYTQETYTYDAFGNLTSEFPQTWNGSAWVNSALFTYTFDSIGRSTGILFQTWNGSGWANNFRVVDTWLEVTAVKEHPAAPLQYSLANNYPNPFNPTTVIRYSIAAGGQAAVRTRLKIYDVLGRLVATLVDDERQPGEYSVQWDARNAPSGVYFYRLQAGAFTEAKKLILTK